MKCALRLLLMLMVLTPIIHGCDNEEPKEITSRDVPTIELDNFSATYSTAVNEELIIEPIYTNAKGADFRWYLDDLLLSESPALRYRFTERGEYLIKLVVTNSVGSATQEIRVKVSDLPLPLVSIAIPKGGLKIVKNTKYLIAPDIQNRTPEDFYIEWQIDGTTVGTDEDLTISMDEVGKHILTVSTQNKYGDSSLEIEFEVIDGFAPFVILETPMYEDRGSDKAMTSVQIGRTYYLEAIAFNFRKPKYSWKINTQTLPLNSPLFKRTAATEGTTTYTVFVTETDLPETGVAVTRNITRAEAMVSAQIKVSHVNVQEQSIMRAATADSSPYQSQVFEFVPAPGQFINEISSTSEVGQPTTIEEAKAYAKEVLDDHDQLLSLGSFGGFVTVGFDHSIPNRGDGYDFAVYGNAFDGNSEPGIVWVMQDTNQNGVPDDEWYELAGSEKGREETLKNFAVTYYRPDAESSPVPWFDRYGWNGSIDYLGQFHSQSSYYPLWILPDSYTLIGTRLKDNKGMNSAGHRVFNNFQWGYADNFGEDGLKQEGSAHQAVGFKISNAVDYAGDMVELRFIDFIKIQTGVLSKNGIIGENSTEINFIRDLSIQ